MPQAKQNGENGEAQNGPSRAEVWQIVIDDLMDEAEDLQHELAGLQQRITVNRRELRDKQRRMTAAQKKWLAAFYPAKVKGAERSKADIEATRKLRAAARKGKSADEVATAPTQAAA